MTTGLEGWLEQLADKKIPILRHRRDQVIDILSDDTRSASECQPIILSDPGLAVNLFQIMNTQRLKANRLPITTVSSLISLFGVSSLLQEIGKMVCFEDLGLPEENLLGINRCLKQSWYCSQFALKWVIDREAREPEEVHVAAILQCLPEIMLWTYGGDVMQKIEHRAYCECGDYYKEVSHVLGCRKREIGAVMAERWALPEIALFGFETSYDSYTHGTAVGLAALLARLCQHGWYGRDMKFFLNKATHYLGENENAAIGHIHQMALDLAEDEVLLGYRPVASLLISSDDKQYPEKEYCMQTAQAAEEKSAPAAFTENNQQHETDAEKPAISFDKKQFASDAAQMKTLVKQKAGFNELLKHTVLTVHKTLGFERVNFMLLTPDKTKLVSKLNLSTIEPNDELKTLSVDLKVKSLFTQIMSKPQAFCLASNNAEKFWPLIPGNVKSMTHSESFCAVSVFSGSKPVGMIYVDKQNQQITAELFKAFQQMTMMLNKALEILSKK